jgi:pyridoxal phosphate enzyme (YggS family)
MTTTGLTQRLAAVQQRIRLAEQQYHRPAGSVRLLAVSKTRGPAEIATLAGAGQQDFGENYLQEALEKIHVLQEKRLTWHFIGAIQSNKTRELAQHFDWIHSIDRLKIARRLNEQRPADLSPLQVCLQVNIDNEPSKAGLSPPEVLPIARELASLPQLRLRGLMAIPAPQTGFEVQRLSFRALAELQQRLIADGLALDTLSMGMSDDMEAAIAEGATLVRIGTDIFGPRA